MGMGIERNELFHHLFASMAYAELSQQFIHLFCVRITSYDDNNTYI